MFAELDTQRQDPALKDDVLQPFIRLIALHTGLQIRPEECPKLQQVITARMRWHRLTAYEAYYRLLEAERMQVKCEWEAFIHPFTVGESYFFRDLGHFNLLRQHILPEIIERQRTNRSLSLWSAGCSTGEEPYSLAILLHELLPSYSDWQIAILGTDINPQAIAQAQRGLFTAWSFRAVESSRRARYFHPHGDTWELDERYRRMVTFRQGNLLTGICPDGATSVQNFDLILCRNVFIYFDREAVARVLAKFTAALKPGGYLITGHAELHDQKCPQLQPKTFPDAVIYQRLAEHAAPTVCPGYASPTPSLRLNSNHTLAPSPVAHRQEAANVRPFTRHKLDATAMQPTQADHNDAPSTIDVFMRRAQAYANAREYAQAALHCHQAIALDPFATQPYHLLAQMAEEQGDIEAAKAFLKKILYLFPSNVPAYLELGALYAKEHDIARAREMHLEAQELLKAMTSDAIIDHPSGALTVAELLPEVERSVARLGKRESHRR